MDSEEMDGALRKALNRARSSARARWRAFDLDMTFLRGLWDMQAGRCAVSGIPFHGERHDGAFVKTPFGPSLDRRDNAKGYTKDNVRLVCMAANFAMNQWSDNVLRRLAHGVVETERRAEKSWFKEQRRKLRRVERAAQTMTGEELARQEGVVAGLKASITLGPARLRGRARKRSIRK